MCKYKPLLTKIETFYIVALFNISNCRFFRLQIPRMWAQDFYPCPSVGNSLSVTQKSMIFDIEIKGRITLLKYMQDWFLSNFAC